MFVYLLATLDTKGSEAAFLRDLLNELGSRVRVVDVGSLAPPGFTPDVPRERVFAAAGSDIAALATADRGAAVNLAALGAARLLQAEHAAGQVAGIIALGGSAGTTIGTAAMRALPIGVPKVMLSTLASGQVRPYVGDKDIAMFNSVVDIAGVNRISRVVLSQAAAALVGMISHPPVESPSEKPLVAATMFGVTTPCVQHARKVLEEAGCEVLVFHATGSGGQAMEALVRDGLISGVLDLTTTELADELVGGVLSAGPTRLTAAAERGVPQVVSVGALDMVNFGPRETVPSHFAHRKFHVHNASVTLMRTTPQENAQLGEAIATKLQHARGPVTILLPLEGVSALDRTGQAFDDTAARHSLFDAIRTHARGLEVHELPLHINDPAFAEAAARRLLELMELKEKGSRG